MNKKSIAIRAAILAGLFTSLETQAFVRLDPVPTPNIVEPIYTVSVAKGATTNLCDWLTDNGVAALTEGTLVKEGEGTLVIADDAVKAFTGDIQIKAGRYHAKSRTAFGTTVGKTWVEDGATLDLYWDTTTPAAINEHVYVSGMGTDGNGALYSSSPMNEQQQNLWPKAITLLGDSKLYCNKGGRRLENMTFNLNGYTMTWHNAGWDWTYAACVVSNGCLKTTGATFLYQGMKFQGGPENVVTFGNGSGYRANSNTGNKNDANASWTAVFEDGSKIYAGGGTSGWSGPVVLNGRTALYCQNLWTWMNLWNYISGPGDIGGASSGTAFSGWNCCTVGIRLACPTNSFTGGINLRYNRLVATVNGAIPANGGKVTARGSTITLPEYETCDLPPAEFRGTGVVYNAKGAWRESVVKTEAGTLLYSSQVGAPLLDIQGGAVKLTAANEGLLESVFRMSSSAEISSIWNAGTTLEDALVTSPRYFFRNTSSDPGWQDYMVVTYTGYIVNTNDSDVTYRFGCGFDDRFDISIDGATAEGDPLYYNHEGWTSPGFCNMTLTPGLHKFRLRGINWTGGGGSTAGLKKDDNTYPWSVAKGFAYTTTSTTATNMNDFTALNAANAKGLFLATDGSNEAVQSLLPHFDKIRLAVGTVFDSNGFAYRLADVEGVGAFTNGSLIVTNSLALTVADVNAGENKLTVKGTLTLGENAVIDIVGENLGDRKILKHRTKPLVIATAEGGVNGTPKPSARLEAAHWKTALSDDEKSIVIWYENGLRVIVR